MRMKAVDIDMKSKGMSSMVNDSKQSGNRIWKRRWNKWSGRMIFSSDMWR